MPIIDTHTHLDHLENLNEAMANAQQAGVEAVCAMSMNLKSCQDNLVIKQNHNQPKIFLAMGIHPADVKLEELEPTLQLIRDERHQLSAVGEIGLDFWYKWVRKDDEKKDEQRKVFRSCLEIAKELDLPVIVHARGTWRECFDTVKAVGIKKANFHWYSGPVGILYEIMDAGYFVSTSPSLAYSPQSREAIAQAKIEQLLIETDCPVNFHLPDGTSFKAEPKDVFRTLDAYCELKGVEREKALEVFNNNARYFFNMK